jgi:hypothetical protein
VKEEREHGGGPPGHAILLALRENVADGVDELSAVSLQPSARRGLGSFARLRAES